MKRILAIGTCVLPAFVLVNFFQFNYWFYNNEMPAYLRGGVLAGDAVAAIRDFYEASRNACTTFHPTLGEQCEAYQLALLGDARYVRPFASAAGVLLTVLAHSIDFMQALKFAIIGLATGGAILCGVLLSPFLAGLEARALVAFGVIWVGGWIGTRLLHAESPVSDIVLVSIVSAVVALGIWRFDGRKIPPEPAKDDAEFGHSKFKSVLSGGFGMLAIVLCFWLGYRLHLIFESRYPFLYLLLAVGLGPLLARVLPAPRSLILSGLLAAALYLMSTLIPIVYNLSLPKQHQQSLVAILIFIAIWRGNARVFWALPLILIFDMQNAARLCALIMIAEGIVGFLRREMPIAVAPAALTAVVGIVTTITTAVYPFDQRLYNISDVIAVLQTPAVLLAGLVGIAMIVTTARHAPRASASPMALDRLFVYSASVVVMGGIQIPTWGLLFDAYQLSNIFRGVGVAPTLAVVAVVAASSLKTYQEAENELAKRSSIAALATLLLLMSSTRGRPVSLSQLGEGLRAAVSSHLPDDWLRRRTPAMTLQDNIVYIDTTNVMTGALMQYSILKILLLSRTSRLASEGLTILPFPRPNVRAETYQMRPTWLGKMNKPRGR
jgi:hypothetical protein